MSRPKGIVTPSTALAPQAAPRQRYSVPPFSGGRYHANASKAGDLCPCAICGRGVKDTAKAASATVIGGGDTWGDDQSDTSDPGYMGGYLVGPDCHRRFLVKP